LGVIGVRKSCFKQVVEEGILVVVTTEYQKVLSLESEIVFVATLERGQVVP